MNFRNYATTDNSPTWDTNGNNNNANLVRQSSIYSLTFEEFQNTMGGIGKDFGSMNMDELLKNIWTAEETQGLASTVVGVEGQNGNNLQRQGSLTLPRTLSQKTVDEVWKDLIKESSSSNGGVKDSASSKPQTQRQPTLGEITLEEFLVRAGVVREDNMPQQVGSRTSNNNNGWFGSSDFPRPNNNVLVGFQQQPNRSNGNLNLGENNNNSNLVVPKPQRQNNQPPPLFPKPANVAFAPPPHPSMHLLNNALASPGRRGGMIGIQEHSMNGGLVQSNAGMAGLTPNINASPVSKMSPDLITRSNVDSSPLSPVHYVINRGRKCSAVEKVVERRQRRMIKNRESAARSRARKQAYTIELEDEVRKLKELNDELQRKQEEYMEMQKNKNFDSTYGSRASKRQCLRRTRTGPW